MGRRHIARGRGNLRRLAFRNQRAKKQRELEGTEAFALPRLLAAAAAADSLFVLSLLPPSSDFWGGQWNRGTDGGRAHAAMSNSVVRPVPLVSLGN